MGVILVLHTEVHYNKGGPVRTGRPLPARALRARAGCRFMCVGFCPSMKANGVSDPEMAAVRPNDFLRSPLALTCDRVPYKPKYTSGPDIGAVR